MILQLNPILDALQAARAAGADAVNPDDEVSVEDQGDRWVFEFIPRNDGLGGGVRVSISKGDLRVVRVLRGQ